MKKIIFMMVILVTLMSWSISKVSAQDTIRLTYEVVIRKGKEFTFQRSFSKDEKTSYSQRIINLKLITVTYKITDRKIIKLCNDVLQKKVGSLAILDKIEFPELEENLIDRKEKIISQRIIMGKDINGYDTYLYTGMEDIPSLIIEELEEPKTKKK